MEEKLKSIYGKLDGMTIYEVRQIAREVRAQVVSGKKGDIIDSIMNYARGEAEAKPLTSRGAPPKSDKYDEKLVEEIRACRRSVLSGSDSSKIVLTVSDRESESMRSDVTACGYIQCAGGEYNLVSQDLNATVAPLYLTRFSLREGDKITGTVRYLNDGTSALIGVDAINGKTPSEIKRRKTFASLPREYPSERIVLSKDSSDAALIICDLFAPLALGQRVYICSSPNGGKTSALKKIALGICAKYPQFSTVLLVIGGKPEELSDLNRSFPSSEKFLTDFGTEPLKNAQIAELAFEHAKRRAELGEKVILFADGLVETVGAELAKKLLCNACNAEELGSLTVISTLSRSLPDYASILSTANAVLSLSPELAAMHVYPSIDAKSSYSSREETLLTADELSAANVLRRKFSTEEILEIVKSCGDAGQITEKYKNG